METAVVDPEFPYSLIISLPFPTHRLASAALRALQVDAELSPLVRRSFSLAHGRAPDGSAQAHDEPVPEGRREKIEDDDMARTILRTEYKATTNRMLRVAVNGFMESMGVVLRVMEELDVDVLSEKT